jgi:hypothetical protein
VVQLSNDVFAARRARWLAELSGALDEARRLMLELDLREAGFEAMELYFQIDALRREIDAMRMKRMTRESTNFGPEWMKSPWHPADPAPPKSGAGCEVQVDA